MKNRIFHYLVFVAAIMVIASCTTKKSDYTASEKIINQKIDSLLKLMSLEEKIGQMAQVNPDYGNTELLLQQIREGRIGSVLNAGDADFRNRLQQVAVKESRLGIPLIFGRDVIHGYRTVFPIPLAQSCSWNPELVKKAAKIAAFEASSDGIHWTFSPMLDIARDPRWGRIAESNGEDPYLGSQMAMAMVNGYQGEKLNDSHTVAACAKHYVGYGAAEGGRDYNTTLIPESELRNIYLPPFKAAVESKVATIMSAFNDINGIPASANEFTIRQILRSEWAFDGFVVSDWTSITELINHGYAADEKDAALKAIRAGIDMEMVSSSYQDHLKELIERGIINEELVNEAVRNILRIKIRKGLFDNPFTEKPAETVFLKPEHLETAKELAIQSTVLLKNENNILPLPENIRKVAVIGPLADAPLDQLGMWTPDGRPDEAVTPLNAIRQLLGNNRVVYSAGLEKSRSTDKKLFSTAVMAARQADACILFIGEEQILSGEAHSRAFLSLPGAQEELVATIAQTGKPIIAVIMAGRPLIIDKIESKAKAILYAWHGGTMAGPAISDLLFGKATPSGKLTVSFPRAEGQIPVYYNHRNTGRPPSKENLGIPAGTPLDPVNFSSNYLDLDFTPAYQFGYGLSYTSFEYSPINLSADSLSMNDTLVVRTTIKNTGKFAGTEIVQLYIRDFVGSITRPVKELKAFTRIDLEPGQSKEVVFKLTRNDFAFYGKNMTFDAEPGKFMIWTGRSSDDKDLSGALFYLIK